MPALTIVIVSYNSAAVLGKLLAPLAGHGMDITVVDNGSLDQSQSIARGFPGVQVIESGNIGYGRAANLGFRAAQTPYVLLINPDVVISRESIGAMLALAESDPSVGIVSGQMFYREGGQKHYGKSYDFTGNAAYVEWVVGALMLIRRDALDRVGMFDENIFLFYEETDLCKRFLKAGYKIAVAKDAEAEHEEGGSSSPSIRVLKIKAWHAAWSKSYFHRKHSPALVYFEKSISKIIRSLTKVITATSREARIKNWYELKGVLAFMRGASAFENNVGRLT